MDVEWKTCACGARRMDHVYAQSTCHTCREHQIAAQKQRWANLAAWLREALSGRTSDRQGKKMALSTAEREAGDHLPFGDPKGELADHPIVGAGRAGLAEIRTYPRPGF